MNKTILMGRLTRDPEIRYPQNPDSKPVARFNLAVDRRFKRDGEPEADFFSCNCFGKLAEFTEKYLRKGSKILVEGSIHNNNYTNKDGQTVDLSVNNPRPITTANCIMARVDCGISNQQAIGSGVLEWHELAKR